MIFLSDNPHVPCTGESDAPVGTHVTIDLEAEDTIVVFALALNLSLDHGYLSFPSTYIMAWGYDKFNRTLVFEHLFAGWAGYRE